MIKSFLIALLALSFALPASQTQNIPAGIYGRAQRNADGGISLIGSGSYATFSFAGDRCQVAFKSASAQHNYVSIQLDGKYLGRYRVDPGSPKEYSVRVRNKSLKRHIIGVYKATEAGQGAVIFSGVKAEDVKEYRTDNRKKIEFIGNSITCGSGSDVTEIACGQGEWFDQHNAYWAFGPQVCRKLDANFVLSSVSGIGMYRNWNDEDSTGDIMPEVYENLNLDTDNSKPYDFKFQPDITAICLGANDLSDGDGSKKRLPFDEKKFVSNYIAFVKTVYRHSPKTRIVLLTSPMISGKKHAMLLKCLRQVIAAFADDKKHKPMEMFLFKPMQPHGCGGHPDIDDHSVMAGELEPFLRKMLAEK